MFSITSLRLYGLKSILIALGSISCVSMMQTPAEAATLYVPSSQYPTIQSAINAANRGDTIIVEAGRTYTENLVLRYKSAGTGYVTIQSSALANLPAAGNRVTPADAANMPTVRSASSGSTPVIEAFPAANPPSHYKFIGINISRHNSTQQQQSLVALGYYGTAQDTYQEVPHNFVFDRCLLRGADNAYTRRGFYFNVRDSQIINSYIENIWEDQADSQGILMTNGAERNLISNNFIEAGSENVMLGGADPDIPNFVPNNITFDRNHFFKRLSWRNANPRRVVKNLFEIKNGKDIVIENNIFENNWAEAQAGHSILFTCRSDGQAPWTVCQNITFRYNIVKNVRSGFNITPTDDYTNIQTTNRVFVNNNLWIIAGTAMGDDGWLGIFPDAGGTRVMHDIVFDHNTFVATSNSPSFLWVEANAQLFRDFVWTNNIVANTAGTWSGVRDAPGRTGTTALNAVAPGPEWTMTGNVYQRASSGHPGSNTYVSSISNFGFRDVAQRDFELLSSSPYKGAAPGGKDIGADMAGVKSRTACVVSGRQSDCVAATSSAAYDFDGDGKSDASLYRPTDGVWYLNRSRDGSTGVNFGISTDKIAPADYDGDGKTDVAVFRPEQNIWYVLNSSNWSVSVRYFGSVGDVPVHADYDADGKADFAVWRPSNGVWYRFNSSDGQFVASQFGLAGDRPAVGDYDGDGRSDLAVYRPTTGVWYLLRSTDGFAAFTFGLPGDVVTPADYTGDGRTDIAVYRPSNGTWYRFDQSNGQMSVFQFGLATDVPTPGDYDGDGKTDLAVYRPSNGTWYFQKSTEGFSTLRYGNSGDVPVLGAFVN